MQQTLQPDSTLQGGKYRIVEILGQGGFGITYLGEQIALARKVAIKEFFMKDLCNRDEETSQVSVGSEGSREMVNRFREKFVKEARSIASLHHKNIVSVIDIFEENGTAYYVMEYCNGGSLSAKLRQQYPDGMPSELALKYIRQIASALDYVHKRRMNHLDVKPANIMLNEDDDAILIDFGLAKQYDAETGQQTSSTPVGISEGYAPIEQYKKGGVGIFSPSTDIYALSATLYKLMTGVTPPGADDVFNEGLPALPASVPVNIVKVINQGMQPRKMDRPQSIEAWLKLLNTAEIETDESTRTATLTDESTSLVCDATNKVEKVSTVASKKTRSSKSEGRAQRSQTVLHKGMKKRVGGILRKTLIVCGILLACFIGLIIVAGVFSDESGDDGVTENQKMLVDNYTVPDTLNINGANLTMIPIVSPDSTKQFYLSETEVTQQLWTTVMGSNPSEIQGDNLPVTNISWFECYEFCAKISQMTGKKFDLPTAEEWMLAAADGYKYSGSDKLDEVAWNKNNSEKTVHPVAQLKANTYGLYDMCGNASEWCQDAVNGKPALRTVMGGHFHDDFDQKKVSISILGSFYASFPAREQGLRLRMSNRYEKVEPVYIDSLLAIYKPYADTHGTENGHSWVDMGLSVKWAFMNVGANKVTDYAGYYPWGETVKKVNDWESYFDLDGPWKSHKCKFKTYYNGGGKTKIEPNDGHDTARKIWGGEWRMPRAVEFEELFKECEWEWSFGGDGYMGNMVTSKKNGNTIFLPVQSVGYCYGTYWTSELSGSNSEDGKSVLLQASSRRMEAYYRLSEEPVRAVF